MMPRRAFSLTELLVVVAIIAVLLALLLPGLRLVRDAAHAVRCASAMRQLGIFCMRYAEDRNGILPPARVESSYTWLPPPVKGPHTAPNDGNWGFWAIYLNETFREDGYEHTLDRRTISTIYTLCPASPAKPTPAQAILRETMMVSYGINTALLDANASPFRAGWPGWGVGIPGFHDNRRLLALVRKPAQTILLAEHWGLDDLNRVPVANDTLVRAWTDPPTQRCPVDAEGVELTPPAGVAPLASGYANRGYAVAARHRKRSNYLFHDGRVEAMSPWQTLVDGDLARSTMWSGR